MVAGLFAYGGWHMVTYTAGETVMPARTIPVALIAGVSIVTACYMAMNVLYLAVLPLDTVRSSTRIAADAADALVGRGGASAMAALVMMSSLGGLTGIVLTGPRVYYRMAGDGLAFRWLDHVHPVYRTPSRAIVVQAVWACTLAATGAYRELFTRVIYTEWLFFALMAFGVFLLRRRHDYHPAYRAWGYPVVPAVFIAVSLVIVVNQIVRTPIEALTGLGMVAVGVPVYYLAIAGRQGLSTAPETADGHDHMRAKKNLRAVRSARAYAHQSRIIHRAHRASEAHAMAQPRIIDFHNHYYPPEYVEALKSPASKSAVKVTYDADGNPCVHYPGDYNILVPGHRDIEYPPARARRARRDDAGADASRRLACTSKHRSRGRPGARMSTTPSRAWFASARVGSRRSRRCRSTIPARRSSSSSAR